MRSLWRLPLRGRARDVASAALVGLLPALLLAGCGDARQASRQVIPLHECRLPKLTASAQCGELTVPENRDKPTGRRITIAVAILPANTLNPQPDPLLIIAGGPGQAASDLAPLAARFTEVRRTRDIVLIDQRGTGRSSALVCAAFKPEDSLTAALDMDAVPKARACLKELAAAGVDPTQYTTEAWVADIDAVRAALGYPRLNLWGGSYGTRVALAYLRRHPDRVRSMVLDGVAPPGMRVPLDVWKSRERAIDDALAACESTAACRAAHPDPRATFVRLAEDLGPDGRRVTAVDPRTGQALTLTLTFDAVLATVQALTYAPERAALIPEIVGRAAAGDYGPLFAAIQGIASGGGEQLNAALHYAVTCTEDASRITAAERRTLDGIRSHALAASVLAVCDVWPRGALAADATEAVSSDVPTLILSGGLDPVTPPANGDAVAATLGNHRHLVAPGYGHIVSPHACVPRLIGAFVKDLDAAKFPESCVGHLAKTTRRAPWPDRMGPQP